MIDETLRVLEYDKVKTLLAGFTATVPGRNLAQELQPLDEMEKVSEALAEISEMRALLEETGRPPVGGSRDLRDALRQVRTEGTWLPVEDLLEILSSIDAARECRLFFTERPQAPLLMALAGALNPCSTLRSRIGESIGIRGEILDGASFQLGDIRYQIRRLRERIKKALDDLLLSDRFEGVFQDRLITERNGRYVVPVKADHRGRIKGFIHDESASGQTLFVEPTAVLDGNNQLQSLLRAEQREEERILRSLSDLVRQNSDKLQHNQMILARIDFRAAGARFSRLCSGTAPQLSAVPLIELYEARHPLLLFEQDGTPRPANAVPVDLVLPEGKDTLVISGPNTGGKSVALKTAGLLVLLIRSGLHIPCRADSKVYLFSKIFADIGDDQSIEESLSTFSGHLTRIKRIISHADKRSLVLLDEIGTGTDPAEGGALAMAVLDALRENGAKTLVTTHLNLVKGYASLEERVENAAVEFDAVTLAPTYRLHYGIPGASKAFTIARRLGLPDSVMSRADRYLGEGERTGLELIEKVNMQQQELHQQIEEARRLTGLAQHERERRKRLLKELEEQKLAILDKARHQGERLVRDAERKIKSLVREARSKPVDVPEQARLAGEIRELKEGLQAEQTTGNTPHRRPVAPKIGELLYILPLRSEGELTQLQGSQAELMVKGKKLRLPLDSLQQFSPRRFAKASTGGGVRSQINRDSFSSKLLLIGKRTDEALALLDRFIDDGLLQGVGELEVVHGAGEGILRREVRCFLRDHKEVKAFHAADIEHGGDNVTIVLLGR